MLKLKSSIAPSSLITADGNPSTRFQLRSTHVLFLATCLIASQADLQAQGMFQNLDFESASVPVVPSGQIIFLPAGDAIPGWTAKTGTNSEPLVMYNGVSAGSAQVSLIDSHTSSYSNNVLGGNFTLTLDAGERTFGIVSASIAQTGVLPATIKSVWFNASQLQFGQIGDLQITFAGQDVPFIQMSVGSNFTTYAGDISAFAGLSGELRFTERPLSSQFSTVALDEIYFSNVAIPEPSFTTLSALGTVILTLRLVGRERRPMKLPPVATNALLLQGRNCDGARCHPRSLLNN